MPTDVRDVLKINIVLVGVGLLKSPDEINAFSNAVGTEVALAEATLVLGTPSDLPLAPGLPGVGRKLAMQRDRITLQLMPDRTVVEREYPDKGDLGRLAGVVDHAVRHSELNNGRLRAFGYNLELVYNQTSGDLSFQYLGKRLFGNGEIGPEGWKLMGGAGRLFFDSPDGLWAIQVEPRGNDENTTSVFMNVNLHKAEQQVPELNELKTTFAHVWERGNAFITHLDERV